MAEKRSSALREILRPWLARLLVGIPVLAGLYQFGCDQFDWPKLPVLWGMTGGGLPWWGWLLIAQAGFVYALFEYVRRIQLPSPPRSLDETAVDARIEAAILRHIGEGLQRDTVAETFKASDGRFGSIVEHFEGVTKRLSEGGAATEKLAKANEAGLAAALVVLKEQREAVDDLASDLRERAAQALAEQREFQKRMETWVGNLQRKLRYGLASIDHAHAAILDRENMKKLLVQIEDVREELSGPTDRQEPIGDMNAWLAKYGGWYRNVEAWARFGEKYRPGTLKRVFAITDSDHEGDWKATDDLFPDSKAVHKYKTFRIYSRNFFAELEAVERCVEQAAFVHPTKRPQPVLEEEDYDDQPYIPPPPPKV